MPSEPLTSKEEGQQTRQRREEGEEKHGRGTKTPMWPGATPTPPQLSTALGPAGSGIRGLATSQSSGMCRNTCQERVETRLHL